MTDKGLTLVMMSSDRNHYDVTLFNNGNGIFFSVIKLIVASYKYYIQTDSRRNTFDPTMVEVTMIVSMGGMEVVDANVVLAVVVVGVSVVDADRVLVFDVGRVLVVAVAIPPATREGTC